ncbi:MAG: DEAD/DEAH box helicase [Nitrospirae bacterium]|nr:DEAD/DEAH box helicase [Nitrospirota bacterium]
MDYLFYLYDNPPKSYLNTKTIMPIEKAKGQCIVQGVVTYINMKDNLLMTRVKDKTGELNVIFFSYNQYHKMRLKRGLRVTLCGKVTNEEMVHPKILGEKEVGIIKPIFGKGITTRKITKAIESIADTDDPVPPEILLKRGLPDLKETFIMLYFPDSMDDVELARWRLAYTELYAQLSSLSECPGPDGIALSFSQKDVDNYVSKFPFTLTDSQKKAINEIFDDLRSGISMRRILVGDVGSGKTEVAMAAAYATVNSGYRVLYLCPTEILAIQTYHRVAKSLAGIAYVALYTSNEKVNKATPDVLIGTHALLFSGWQYHKIGLVIIDEQHKFGVKQRKHLLPHEECNLLEMSATPIPRSYALFLQSVMNVSILDELPVKRNVETKVIAAADKKDYAKVIEVIVSEVEKDNQALVMYPSVESEKANMRAATKAHKYWESLFGKDRVSLLHGKIQEKETILKRFMNGEIKVLVSTSAAEVGIDVPGLTVCAVANAERFGLAQLHQIRGRVGRRGSKGYFLLICKNKNSIDRLKPLETIDSGFDIAEIDTKNRGFGVLNGNAQSGHFFRFFSLNDVEISTMVKDDLQDAAISSGACSQIRYT